MALLGILGAGESGVGAAILGIKEGFDVFVSDRGLIAEQFKVELDALYVDYEEGQHSFDRLQSADLIIKSPGIPEAAQIVVELKDKGIPIISEIEFAGYYAKTSCKICVTGSNGKTTTSSLIYHLLKYGGYNVGLAGNVGHSFARQVATCNYDYYVLELSSFQLDGMFDFQADIAVLLNITPDHLDRYQNSIDLYALSKFRIVQNMSSTGCFIYNADDRLIIDYLPRIDPQTKLLPFSLVKNNKGVRANCGDGKLSFYPEDKGEETLAVSENELLLRGSHNMQNCMAAVLAALELGLSSDIIRSALSRFNGLPHRLEFVREYEGVTYVNDSKATNVDAVWYALDSVRGDIIWIVGGVDKGNQYEQLKSQVESKVRAIICLGVDNSKIHTAFADLVDRCVDVLSARQAVRTARALAHRGDTVLLAPACSSFDLFKNYEDRGDQFKLEVNRL